jgi:hypothetical protein
MHAQQVYQRDDRINRGTHNRPCLGTVLEACDDASSGYIVQMDADEPGAVIACPGYLMRPAT